MAENLEIKELGDVVVRFSGDSGDGMQLAGNIFSKVAATVGNSISTFPDYPADIRAPQGSLTGVSGFQVHIGAETVYTPGDKCDVLVAMNAAALKTQYKFAKPGAAIIIDTWNAMVKDCLHPNGFLGFVQGTGKEPKDSQPVGYSNEPDFDDFGLGCFLLAGSEVYRMNLNYGIKR